MPRTAKKSPKRAYSSRLARLPRAAARVYGGKRLRKLSGKRRLRGYATGGLVTQTGPAYLHAGEYVTNAATPHPFKTAIVNPFLVDGVRIPDDTSYQTFTVTQTNSITLSPQNGSAAGAHVVGVRLRPSLCDGSGYATETGTLESLIRGDQTNFCLAYFGSSANASRKLGWAAAHLYNASEQDLSVKAYVWGTTASNLTIAEPRNATYIKNQTDVINSVVEIPATQSSTTVPGPMGYALQQGSKIRPVAWGLRIRYGGLNQTGGDTSLNPFGRIFFGTYTPESEGNLPGQTDFDTMPVYDGSRSARGRIQGGPGYEIDFAQLQADATRGVIGMVTLEELRKLPNGLVVATGPRSTSERLFEDVDYAAGKDRFSTQNDQGAVTYATYSLPYNESKTQLGVATANQVQTLPASQPWMLVQDGFNAIILVEQILHWEVVPSTQAYTLPGTLKCEAANTAIMDAASNILSLTASHPREAAYAASG